MAHTASMPVTLRLHRASRRCCRWRRRKQAESEGVKQALRSEPGADEDPYHALMLSNPTTGPNSDKDAINSLGCRS